MSCFMLDDQKKFVVNGYRREKEFGFDSKLYRKVTSLEVSSALKQNGIRVRPTSSFEDIVRVFWQAIGKLNENQQYKTMEPFRLSNQPSSWYKSQCCHYGVRLPNGVPKAEMIRILEQAFLNGKLLSVPKDILSSQMKIVLESSQKDAYQWTEWKKACNKDAMIEKDGQRFFSEWNQSHTEITDYFVYKSKSVLHLHKLELVAKEQGLIVRVISPTEFLHCLVVAKSYDTLNRKCDSVTDELENKEEKDHVDRKNAIAQKAYDLKKVWKNNTEWTIKGHWVLKCEEADVRRCIDLIMF